MAKMKPLFFNLMFVTVRLVEVNFVSPFFFFIVNFLFCFLLCFQIEECECQLWVDIRRLREEGSWL